MTHPDHFQYVPKQGNGYVYHILVGQKHYIGISTTPFSVRWDRHKAPYSGCKKLVRELNRIRNTDQWSLLRVQVLQQAQNKDLDKLQQKYIRKYSSYNNLYGLNSTPGGRDVTPVTLKKARKKPKSKQKKKPRCNSFTWSQV